MTIHSTDNDDGNSFEYRLKEVSDDEIINILRFREHFQPHAVREAIKEALRRGIISSIDDLEKDEFKSQPLPSRSLFHISAIENQNISVFRSLCRIIYIFSCIPIVYGILQITHHNYISAAIAILIGLAIISLTYKLEKERKTLYSQIQLFINIPTIGYVIYYVLSQDKINTMDIFTGVIIIVVMLYSTLYLHKLNLHFNKNSR